MHIYPHTKQNPLSCLGKDTKSPSIEGGLDMSSKMSLVPQHLCVCFSLGLWSDPSLQSTSSENSYNRVSIGKFTDCFRPM